MLKGETIHLRTVRSKDLGELLDFQSDVESFGVYFPLRIPTETSLRQRFDKDGFWADDNGVMLIVETATDRMIGIMAYFPAAPMYDAVEVGYILYRPGDRGKGYVPQALKLFMTYLFGLKRIDRIQLQIEPGNTASRRVAEKAGFTFEGTIRSAILRHGQSADINMFSMLRSEFEATL